MKRERREEGEDGGGGRVKEWQPVSPARGRTGFVFVFFQLFWQCIIHKAKRRDATKLIPLHSTGSGFVFTHERSPSGR